MTSRASRIAAALALSLVVLAGCHTVSAVSPNPALPDRSSRSWAAASADLRRRDAVLFDGTSLEIVTWSDTRIDARLPASKPTDYPVIVQVGGATALGCR